MLLVFAKVLASLGKVLARFWIGFGKVLARFWRGLSRFGEDALRRMAFSPPLRGDTTLILQIEGLGVIYFISQARLFEDLQDFQVLRRKTSAGGSKGCTPASPNLASRSGEHRRWREELMRAQRC